jgi:oleate hydratase
LAAAVFLIRDANILGDQITIYEASSDFGGSLDGAEIGGGSFVTRGGRMFEPHFGCTFDLLASIPSLESPNRSVKDDIDLFNKAVTGSSNCRLIHDGQKVDALTFGLKSKDLWDLTRLMARSEKSLAGVSIDSCFRREFFRSHFWLMWSTTFAFLPWHSAMELRRYFRRFIHLLPGFKKIEGILRTRYNQYDSLIHPIMTWLRAQGVRFRPNCEITDVEITHTEGRKQAVALHVTADGSKTRISLTEKDRVFLTLGSMTENSYRGSTALPPTPGAKTPKPWSLWQTLAARDSAFGHPQNFCRDVEKTTWTSFTATLPDSGFFDYMEEFTSNKTGTGGLVTIKESNWLLSIVMFHQPHFEVQPAGSYTFWGYGLHGHQRGNFVNKPMAACNGAEILHELSGHLKLDAQAVNLFKDAVVIPTVMPLITSQFMPRAAGDRPVVKMPDAINFAVMGQYCEQPDDVVFTVEYSVRSSMMAVYSLFEAQKTVPTVSKTFRNPKVLVRATRTLLQG